VSQYFKALGTGLFVGPLVFIHCTICGVLPQREKLTFVAIYELEEEQYW
jgi:hypothetical protein